MNIKQITALAAQAESETLELKATTGTRREAVRTVCAFLNQGAGKVLFGVTADGTLIGQQIGERTIEELSEEIRRIDPPAFPSIERVPVSDGREVIVVSVERGASRPYTYRGSAYRRIGNTTLAMSADEYKQTLLERVHPVQRWENQPADGWSLEDLDTKEIRRTVRAAVELGRLDEPPNNEPLDLLRGLGLLLEDELTLAAVVLFGGERLQYEMPQCLLRVARFRGFDKMHFLDNRQFKGNAFKLLADAERFLRDTLPIAARFEPDRIERIDLPLYPPMATREALANALCHRDYSIGGGSIGVAVYDDRLEITSAGPLHFGLTPEQLFEPHESRPWNPLIAQTFYRRGIIEVWGGGTLKMAELTNDAGIPLPEIKDQSGTVTVCFRHGQFVPLRSSKAVSPAQRREMLLALLDTEKEGLTRREIHARVAPHASERQVRRALEDLRDGGLVVSTNEGPLTRWKRKA